MAWGFFKENAWRIRSAGLGGIAGVDTSVAQARLERAGVDPQIAEDLLAACERGFLSAVNEKDED